MYVQSSNIVLAHFQAQVKQISQFKNGIRAKRKMPIMGEGDVISQEEVQEQKSLPCFISQTRPLTPITANHPRTLRMLLTIALPLSRNVQTFKHTYPFLAGMLLTKPDPKSGTTRLKLTCTAPRAIGSSLWTARHGITAWTYRPVIKQIWLDLVRTPPLLSLRVAAMCIAVLR